MTRDKWQMTKWAIRRTRKFAWVVMATLLLNGCCCLKSPAPAAKIDNVYRVPGKAHPKRVAVLPISFSPADWQAAEGAKTLQPALISELAKRQRFEIAVVTGVQMEAWTGRGVWHGDEMLPHNLFEKLQLETGCDAVLFTHLGAYQPYEPIVMGWTLKMVDAQSAAILWAVDEVFDGARRPVTRTAAQCIGRPFGWTDSSSDTLHLSPRRFGEYTFGALLDTLPEI